MNFRRCKSRSVTKHVLNHFINQNFQFLTESNKFELVPILLKVCLDGVRWIIRVPRTLKKKTTTELSNSWFSILTWRIFHMHKEFYSFNLIFFLKKKKKSLLLLFLFENFTLLQMAWYWELGHAKSIKRNSKTLQNLFQYFKSIYFCEKITLKIRWKWKRSHRI